MFSEDEEPCVNIKPKKNKPSKRTTTSNVEGEEGKTSGNTRGRKPGQCKTSLVLILV